jgi:protease-4
MDDFPTGASGGMASSPPPPPQAPAPTPPPLLNQPIVVQAPRKKSSGWKTVAIIFLILFLCSLVFNPLHFIARLAGEGGSALPGHKLVGPRLQEAFLEDNSSRNKIVVVPMEGVITGQGLGRSGYTMVDLIEDEFQRAAKDQSVKAVILKVNSPGGEVLASDDIYRIIRKFEDQTGKPVVAAMGSLAASGGYYVSAPCRWIVANEMTITGSIGVIMHGYNWRGLMDKVGIRPEVFKSGKFKDMLSPDKRPEDVDPQEREMIQSMVNETFDKFKSIVREGRGSAATKNKTSADKGQTLAENWEQYADGRVLSGKEALRLGFVDELGNFDVAVSRARKLAAIGDANLIQYQQPFDISDLLGFLGKSEGHALKIDLGLDTPKLQLGHLYFLCPLVLPH